MGLSPSSAQLAAFGILTVLLIVTSSADLEEVDLPSTGNGNGAINIGKHPGIAC